MNSIGYLIGDVLVRSMAILGEIADALLLLFIEIATTRPRRTDRTAINHCAGR